MERKMLAIIFTCAALVHCLTHGASAADPNRGFAFVEHGYRYIDLTTEFVAQFKPQPPSAPAESNAAGSSSSSAPVDPRDATDGRDPPTDSPHALPPSVRYAFLEQDSPRPLKMHRLEIDLTSNDIELSVAMGDDPDGEGPIEAALTPPVQLADRLDMVCAVNTNAWAMFPDPKTGRKTGYVVGGAADIKGWAVALNDARSRPEEGYWSCWMDDQGECHMGASWKSVRSRDATQPAAVWAISGFGGLLRGGTVLPPQSTIRHPRTALGLNSDGKRLTLLVVDGRQPTVSEGVSEYELAELLLAQGCTDAMNLDGGGSSVMLIRQSDGALAIVNRPSDPSGARPVPVVLGVRRSLAAEPMPRSGPGNNALGP